MAEQKYEVESMKKLFVYGLVFLLVVCSVCGAKHSEKSVEIQDKVRVEETVNNRLQSGELANLNGTMNQFREANQNRFRYYRSVEVVDVVEGSVVMNAYRNGKLLGFINFGAKDTIVCDESGEVVFEKKPWYNFMFREEMVV